MPNVSYQDDGGGGGGGDGGAGDGVLGGTVFRVIQRCDFFYTLMSSVLLGGLTSIAVVALTRKHCNSFHYSARTVVQCRTGNRRRRTFPATEPNRAAVEIALLYTCATETRAAGAILSIRCAPSDRAERPQSDGGDRA